MGNVVSDSKDAPEFNCSILETWSLNHCKLVSNKYEKDNYDFGVTRPDFKSLFESVVPNADDHERNLIEKHAEEIWDILDPNGAGMVATLESLCYACTGCQGTLEDKTAFVFDLFDFNNGGDISYDEMVILMSSVLCAMIKFNNNALNVETKLPDDAQMEALTDKAFLDADANMNGTIHKAEFKDWVLNTLAKDDLAVTVSDILLEFELVEKSASFEEEQPGSDGDQCGAGGIVSSREPWLTTSMDGMGEIAVEYNLDKGMFTFSASGLSCTASDDGFVQTKYLRKLAKMKAKKLKILSVKQSRNKKRAPTQELVISPRWADQDDLSDYLQLVCLSLTEKEKALRARKELLESRIADME